MVSLLSMQTGRSPPPLLEQNMDIFAVIINVIAVFVPKYLLHCLGVLFHFISVAVPH